MLFSTQPLAPAFIISSVARRSTASNSPRTNTPGCRTDNTIFLDTEATGNACINVHRPCGGEPFVSCLYEIMQLGRVVFFELDGIRAITLSPDMEHHLLDGMLESIGMPVLATNWEEFMQLWQNNRI